MSDDNKQLNNTSAEMDGLSEATINQVEITDIVGVDEQLETPLDYSAPVSQSVSVSIYTGDNARRQRNKRVDKALTIILAVLILCLVFGLVMRVYIGCRIGVSGESMLPNLVDGQIVWVNKTILPNRGDVVVVYRNDVDNRFLAEFSVNESGIDGKYEKLIKRVIALPGDKIWLENYNDGKVLVIKTVDGEILREDYYTVNGEPAQFYDPQGELGTVAYLGTLGNLAHTDENNPFVVPEGKFYFMGDNRFNSNDSRVLGVFPLSRLYGVVVQR